MRDKRANASRDREIAHLAAGQHGVVSAHQLATAGIDRAGIARRVKAGRLHRVYRGVYAVGHLGLSNEGRWMAAVLALGVGAVLSHRSAAELWRMLPQPLGPGLVDVTVRGNGGRHKRPGIRLHRSSSLPSTVTTRHRGIRVTTPARTVADLRRVAGVDDVRRAIREAEFRRLDLGDERAQEEDLTRTKLEREFLRLCRRHRLPKPEVNVHVGPFEVDFLWRDRKLIVETDGWQAHRGRQAFEDDRAKDVKLKLLGYQVVRFTYWHVTEEPQAVGAALCALLS